LKNFRYSKNLNFFPKKNGKRHGQGAFIFLNGTRFEGEFQNGLMHGKGILYNIFDKTKTTGNWFNGKMISKDEE